MVRACDIEKASRIIQRGGLVVFPTETVYGLGANALNSKAVRKIFALKQRPADNPLIVHIAKAQDLFIVARGISNDASVLMKKFWPGPLTLVFKKTKRVPNVVTAGLNTVAVRMPSNPVARALILSAGVPIAAPSANLAGRPSATKAMHAISDFRRKSPFVLDAGRSRFGVESTVFDMTGRRPILLRQGATPRENIERILHKKILLASHSAKKPRSPGMKYRHYAPKVPLYIVSDIVKAKRKFAHQGAFVGIIKPKRNLTLFARTLFSDIRRLEAKGVDCILVQKTARKGIGAAIMDRLTRASTRV